MDKSRKHSEHNFVACFDLLLGGYGRVNSKGFHGDERPDARLEQQLFHKPHTQTTGINFDKYDDIPIETGGEVSKGKVGGIGF